MRRYNAAMTTAEHLKQLIDRLPAEKQVELERIVVAMLRDEPAASGAPPMGFEEALAYTNETLGDTLKRLAQ